MTSGSSSWRRRLHDISRRTPVYQPSKDNGVLSTRNKVMLSANENLFLNREALREIIVEAASSVDPRKYASESVCRLEKTLAEKHDISPEQILIGNGGDQLIDLLVRSIAGPRSTVVSVTPTFSMYRRYVLTNNATYREVPLENDFTLDVTKMLGEIDSVCQLVFLCSPNNPTARSFSQSNVEKIVSQTSSLVVIDEAYADFADTSFVDFIESYENLVVIRTFSKSLGLAGLRVGYALGEKNLISTIKTSVQHPFPVSSLAIEIGIRLLKREDLVEKAIRETIGERKRLISNLNNLSAVKAFDSETNFVLFKTKQTSKELTTALAQKGVGVRNIGRVLDHRNCIRATVGPQAIMDYFVNALKEVIP